MIKKILYTLSLFLIMQTNTVLCMKSWFASITNVLQELGDVSRSNNPVHGYSDATVDPHTSADDIESQIVALPVNAGPSGRIKKFKNINGKEPHA